MEKFVIGNVLTSVKCDPESPKMRLPDVNIIRRLPVDNDDSWDFNGVKTLYIGPGIQIIDQSSFSCINTLEEVYFDENPIPVELELGEETFSQCHSLRKIRLPRNLTNIPVKCFNACYELEEVTIPERVSSIGEYAFFGCFKLRHVSIDRKKGIFIEDSAFAYTNLEDIHLNNVIQLEHNAFAYCENLKSVTIDSASGLNLLPHVFLHCQNLINVNLPDETNAIGIESFAHCRSLLSLRIPPMVQYIHNTAFKYHDDNLELELCKDSPYLPYQKKWCEDMNIKYHIA